MKKSRTRFLTVVLTLTAALLTFSVALADGWSVDLDFAESDEGFDIPTYTCFPTQPGVYTGGVGWVATETPSASTCNGFYYNWIMIHKHFDAPTTIITLELTYDLDIGEGGAFQPSIVIGDELATTATLDTTLGARYASEGDGMVEVFDYGAGVEVSDIYIMMVSAAAGAPIGDAGYARMTGVHATGEGDLDPWTGEGTGPYRPVDLADTWTISEEHGSAFVKTSAGIHSINAGTITDITPVSGMFKVTVAPVLAETEADYITYYNLQGVNGEVGDMVAAGCVLGLLTGTVTTPTFGDVGVFNIDAPADILEDWPDYPDSPTDTPCNADKLSTVNCIDINPNFANNAQFWNAEGHVESQDGGATLFSDGAIYQDVVLDDAEVYTVTIVATTTLGARWADLEITFGDATSLIHLNVPSANQSVRVSSQDLSPGAPDFDPDKYRLKIRNVPPTGHLATPVMVLFVCIGTEEPVSAPGSCYYDDAENMVEANWSTDGDVDFVAAANSTSPGSFTIGADGMIFRDVSISAFADLDTTFTLTTKTWNGAGTPLTPPYGRWHAYIRDSGTLDIIQEIGTWDTNPIIATFSEQSFTVESGETLTGDLVIENTSSAIDMTGWTQHINYACLSVDGGVWPGYDNTDIAPSLFTPDCKVCSQPAPLAEVTGDALLSLIVGWLQFGWCYLGFILRCLVLTALNNLILTIGNFMAGVALFGKWIGMVVTAVANWARDGFRFGFNGMVASLIPIANMFIAWLQAMPLVQGALDALAIAAIWIGGLFELINNVIGLILLGLQFIGALLNLIGVAWTAFLAALSSTPSTLFPFPDCTNPASPLYDACIPLDVTNFLVTRIPALLLLINVAAFSVFWRQIRKIIRAVREDIFEPA